MTKQTKEYEAGVRAGYAAGVEAAARECERQASFAESESSSQPHPDYEAEAAARLLEAAADHIRALSLDNVVVVPVYVTEIPVPSEKRWGRVSFEEGGQQIDVPALDGLDIKGAALIAYKEAKTDG